METSAPTRSPERAGLMLIGAAVVVVALYLVRDVSAAVYRAVVPHTADLPGIGALADAVLLVLVGLYAVLAAVLWRTRSPRLVELLLGGAGVLVAYALSEVIKVVVGEERPCRTEVALAACPAPGDWSFPSNHTTIAAGLATAVVLAAGSAVAGRAAAGWWRGVVIGLAVVVGLGRVLPGAHYPHDVLAGAVLGACVTIAVVVMLAPWAHGRTDGRIGARPPHVPAAGIDS